MARYVIVFAPEHPNARADGWILEHTLVMSQLLNRALMPLEVVHHIDNDGRNNAPANLMLFSTNAEHLKHHAKERAFNASGNASFMRCKYCKEYDAPEKMYLFTSKLGKTQAHHSACSTAYTKAWKRAKKLKSL